MILHLVNSSPWQTSALNDCLVYAAPVDAILLMGEGVYACNKQDTSLMLKHSKVFALLDDLKARGIEDSLPEHISAIEFQQFVELSLEYKSTMKWS